MWKLNEEEIAMWKKKRPEKEQFCIVIIEFVNSQNVFIMKYVPSIDCFVQGNEDSVWNTYKFEDIKCWTEYPENI